MDINYTWIFICRKKWGGGGEARDSVTPHSLHCLCLYVGKAWSEQWMDSSVSCGENDLILQTKNGTCELEKTVNLFISSGCFSDTVLSCWVFCISETVIAWNFLCTQQKTHHLSFRRLESTVIILWQLINWIYQPIAQPILIYLLVEKIPSEVNFLSLSKYNVYCKNLENRERIKENYP